MDIGTFFDIVIVIAAVVTPAVLAARMLRGAEQGSLAGLFRAPDRESWPVGVQEEEPVAWAFAASRRSPVVAQAAPARPVVAVPSAA